MVSPYSAFQHANVHVLKKLWTFKDMKTHYELTTKKKQNNRYSLLTKQNNNNLYQLN